VPKLTANERNLRTSLGRPSMTRSRLMQDFRGCWRDFGPRLKIVVSPVRVRVSPSVKPCAAWIFSFPERLSYRTRIGTREGPCSQVRARIARRARESGKTTEHVPVMSFGSASRRCSRASAVLGAPRLRLKDPAAMPCTMMRRRTPGPHPRRAWRQGDRWRLFAAVNSRRLRFPVVVSLCGVYLLVGRWFACGVSDSA
jgi:hypothetical protein